LSANFFASLRILLKDLENSAPLVYGTTQNEQNLSQPSCIVKNSAILDFLKLFKLSRVSNFSINSKLVSEKFSFLSKKFLTCSGSR